MKTDPGFEKVLDCTIELVMLLEQRVACGWGQLFPASSEDSILVAARRLKDGRCVGFTEEGKFVKALYRFLLSYGRDIEGSDTDSVNSLEQLAAVLKALEGACVDRLSPIKDADQPETFRDYVDALDSIEDASASLTERRYGLKEALRIKRPSVVHRTFVA